MTNRALTYGDLPRAPKYGVCLYCPACGATFSATRGDYFQQSDMTPVDECGTCGDAVLELRCRHPETYTKITPAHAETPPHVAAIQYDEEEEP